MAKKITEAVFRANLEIIRQNFGTVQQDIKTTGNIAKNANGVAVSAQSKSDKALGRIGELEKKLNDKIKSLDTLIINSSSFSLEMIKMICQEAKLEVYELVVDEENFNYEPYFPFIATEQLQTLGKYRIIETLNHKLVIKTKTTKTTKKIK